MARFVVRYVCYSGVKRVLADFPLRDEIAFYEAKLYVKENTQDTEIEIFQIERLPRCQEKVCSAASSAGIPVSRRLLKGWRWFHTRLRQKLK